VAVTSTSVCHTSRVENTHVGLAYLS
jgi:hypothetical protein